MPRHQERGMKIQVGAPKLKQKEEVKETEGEGEKTKEDNKDQA